MKVKATFDEEGRIVSVQIHKKTQQLKQPLDFKEAQELIKAINIVEKYVDFSEGTGTVEDLIDICSDLTPKQRNYLKTLLKGPRTANELKESLGLKKTREIAGIRQGLTRRVQKKGLKPLDVVKLHPKSETYKYAIREVYKDILPIALDKTK